MRFEPQEPGSLMLALKLAAVRLVLLAENITRALWPIIALLFFAGALVLFDLLPLLPGWLHLAVLLALAGAAALCSSCQRPPPLRVDWKPTAVCPIARFRP